MRPTLAGSVALAFLLTGCSGEPPSILEPAGPGARTVAGLWWPMLWISTVVFLVVGAMLVWAVARGRRDHSAELDRTHVRWGEPFIALAGVFLPFLILGGTYVMSLRAMDDLAARGSSATMTIEVIGRDWWWEVRYPNGAVTANEIHIPAGETVRVELTTKDVIHSFWVPELQVKTDQIPGTTSYTWLHADRPGRYRGQCAEFCGLQHANMIFYVFAEPRDDFDAWVAGQAQPADPAAGRAAIGETIFLQSSCVGCHTIRGTDAEGVQGPDLTHIASRATIGGAFPNSGTRLEKFIFDPHLLKPGVAMPPAELTREELSAVVLYLGSLD